MLSIRPLNFGLGQAEPRQPAVGLGRQGAQEIHLRPPRLKRGRILYARRAQGRMGICKEQAVLKAAGSPSKIQCDLPALVICEEPGLLTEY